jgi:phage virion morphogenesis protein
MTGVTYTVTFDDQAVDQRLAGLIDSLQNPSGFLKGVGEHLVNSNRQNFDREAASDGTPWAPLSPATIKARQKKGQVPIQILTATKALNASIFYQVEVDALKVGSGLPYAAIHQLGGVINKPARTGRAFGRDNVSIPAHTISMPARPYLGVSAEDETIIIELAEDWLNPS